jgi:hypothetical protein
MHTTICTSLTSHKLTPTHDQVQHDHQPTMGSLLTLSLSSTFKTQLWLHNVIWRASREVIHFLLSFSCFIVQHDYDNTSTFVNRAIISDTCSSNLDHEPHHMRHNNLIQPSPSWPPSDSFGSMGSHSMVPVTP